TRGVGLPASKGAATGAAKPSGTAAGASSVVRVVITRVREVMAQVYESVPIRPGMVVPVD
ncbi:hypothetical protein EFN19_04210, partial [Propionibacterium freudenreichii]|nr:hypothetical protein [Propionibacterium freudenreichii]